jgi:hypothetical protein
MDKEFIGYEDEIYSIFHCDLYTLTIVQSSNGTIEAISYETEEGPIMDISI